MTNSIKAISLDELSNVTGGSKYSVDESVRGVKEFIEVCKTARANNLSNGSQLDSNQALDWLWSKYLSYGLEDRLDCWGYGDILERYYFEDPHFM